MCAPRQQRKSLSLGGAPDTAPVLREFLNKVVAFCLLKLEYQRF
jgi:hypothetical protein